MLVVGFGNSGIDIAGHLIAAGAHVRVSMRTPPNLARREILGLPGQPLAVVADHVPARLADSTFSLTQRMLFGDLTRLGIPRARDGVYTNFYRRLRSPAIDDGFIAALKQGQAQVVAEVARLDGPQVVLADGSRLRPDAVICATGYRRGLEPLVGHLGVLRPDGVPFAYRGAPEHPAAPQLYFAGCGPVQRRDPARPHPRPPHHTRRRPPPRTPRQPTEAARRSRTKQTGLATVPGTLTALRSRGSQTGHRQHWKPNWQEIPHMALLVGTCAADRQRDRRQARPIAWRVGERPEPDDLCPARRTDCAAASCTYSAIRAKSGQEPGDIR